METMKKLQGENLTYSIDGRAIIEDISLQIAKGEFVGIIGPNGCGKSTLLKNIYRVYQPDGGVAFIDGDDVRSLSHRETARRLAVMQQENPIEFDMTVFDMVMLGRYAHRRFLQNDRQEDYAIVHRYIHEVGLDGYEGRSFLTLSGGEKQRALVARALAQQAPLIILDEPTNHLDFGYQYQVLNILKRQGLTVLACIHDLNIAAAYCDRLIVMKQGRVVAAGSPAQILTSERIDEVFGTRAEILHDTDSDRLHVLFLPETM